VVAALARAPDPNLALQARQVINTAHRVNRRKRIVEAIARRAVPVVSADLELLHALGRSTVAGATDTLDKIKDQILSLTSFNERHVSIDNVAETSAMTLMSFIR